MTNKPSKPLFNLYLIFLGLICVGVLFFIYAARHQINSFLYLAVALIFILGFLIPISGRFQYSRALIHLQQKAYLKRIQSLEGKNDQESIDNKHLADKIEQLSRFQKLLPSLMQCLSPAQAASQISSGLNALFDDPDVFCTLYIFHSKTGELGISVSSRTPMQIDAQSKKGDLFDRWLVKTMQPLLVDDVFKDPRFSDLSSLSNGGHRLVRSLISVPLIVKTQALGILRVDSLKESRFNKDDLQFINAISVMIGVAIENAELAERMHELGVKDNLTGLYLRRYLMEQLDAFFAAYGQSHQPLSFLMIDLDHFKEYNDTFGHMAGDIVLRTVASALADHFKEENEVICRYGGEEFCVVLPNCSKQTASKLAEEFRTRMERQIIILRRQKTHVTVSIGLATFPQDAKFKEDLINIADRALYKAKNSGRNRVCVA